MKALITGASSGIGREFARLLAARGWDLIVAARSTDKLYELRDELSNVHVRVITIDLSREQDAYDLYEHLQEEHIDMLINNAGFGAYGFFADVPLQREIELIHTNVCSLHILTKLYLQDMLARGSGTILNVGSMAGFSAGPKLSSYYASKNYVVRLTEAIHEELLSPRDVAAYALQQTEKGKPVIIPGTLMKLTKFFSRFLSEKALTSASYNIQSAKDGRKP